MMILNMPWTVDLLIGWLPPQCSMHKCIMCLICSLQTIYFYTNGSWYQLICGSRSINWSIYVNEIHMMDTDALL